jgi:hypothetical protein
LDHIQFLNGDSHVDGILVQVWITFSPGLELIWKFGNI